MAVSREPSSPPPEVNQPEVILPVAENWCNTQVKVVKITFVWTINNFSFYREQIGEQLESSSFSATPNGSPRWRLWLMPAGADEDSKEYVSLFLILVACKKRDLRARFKFALINTEGEEINIMKSPRAIRFSEERDWGFRKFLRRDFIMDEANGLLPDDKLTIFCEVSTVTDSVNFSGQSTPVQFKLSQSRLTDDLELLFENPDFNDVTLCARGREFHAHKGILAARSQVFAAMFQHDMQESQLDKVNITDIDHDVLREILRFIYTGKAANLETMADDLLVAADKYALGTLKEMCEEALGTNLSIENAAEILMLADMHNADQLKAQAISYIVSHATEVMETAEWRKLIRHRPRLIAQVCHALATHQKAPLRKRAKRN